MWRWDGMGWEDVEAQMYTCRCPSRERLYICSWSWFGVCCDTASYSPYSSRRQHTALPFPTMHTLLSSSICFFPTGAMLHLHPNPTQPIHAPQRSLSSCVSRFSTLLPTSSYLPRPILYRNRNPQLNVLRTSRCNQTASPSQEV